MITPLQFYQTKIGAIADGKVGGETLKKFAAMNNITIIQAVHFFAQCDHETGGFTVFSENLNYSATGLMKTFPKYFTPATAMQYARQPEKIANKVYANRMGNGNEASGDGWNFLGRGAIQLTGRESYQRFADSINKPEIMTDPDSVARMYAFDSAIYFFKSKKIWDICESKTDPETIKQVTKAINGGYNGLSDRIEKTLKYKQYVQSIR